MNEMNNQSPFKKVMVIDDNEVDRYIATRHILKYGFAGEVIAIESANAALAYLNSNTNNAADLPGLIFLDINMPEKNGFDFLDEFDKLPDSIKNNCSVMM